MKHRNNMVLYKVLNQEIVFEEYFCNLLQFEDFRDLFIDFLNQNDNIFEKNSIMYENFDTEVKLKNENENENEDGRADLFLKYNNQEYILEIKNKDRTSLTVNQPNGYLHYLKNISSNNNLFFLVPRNYIHKKEIIERWNKFNEKEKRVNTTVEDKILFWQDFITLLGKENTILEKVEIKLFYEFCIYWFDMQAVVLTQKELKYISSEKIGEQKMPSIATIMKKLALIVNGVIDLGIVIDKQYDEQNSEYFGYIINNKKYNIDEKLELWFGVDYNIWEKYSNSSLVLEVNTDDKQILEKIKEIDNVKEFLYEDGTTCYFFNLELTDNEDMKKQFYDFIDMYLKRLQNL